MNEIQRHRIDLNLLVTFEALMEESTLTVAADRVFRIMMPSFPSLVAPAVARARAEAPGVTLEWVNVSAQVYDAVAEGLGDVAHVGGDLRLPEGLDEHGVEPFTWYSCARADHPALADWGAEAWARWPHLQVKIATTTLSPVDARKDDPATTRRIGVKIGEFAAVGTVLSETDLLTTLPAMLMASQMELHNLCAMRPVVMPDRFSVRFVWSSRLSRDPGNLWL